MLLVTLLVRMVFTLPTVVEATIDLQNISSKVEVTSLEGFIETKYPIAIPAYDPIIVVNTKDNTKINADLQITSDEIIYKLGKKEYHIEYADLSKPENAQKLFKNLVFIALLLSVPSLILLFYVLSIMKYILIATLLSLIAVVFGKSLKHFLSFRETFVIAIYTSTISVLIESVMVPLRFGKYILPIYSFPGFSIYFLPLIIWIVLFVIVFALKSSPEYEYSVT